MANLRDLKGRISTVKNIKQITNAMKMVAAAKLRKTQDAVLTARPYAKHVEQMLKVLLAKNKETTNPILKSINPDGKTLLVIVTGDKGLCGSYNSSIIRFSTRYLEENPDCDLVMFGRKGYDYFRRKDKYNIIAHFDNMTEVASVPDLQDEKEEILDLYLSGKYSKVIAIYNEFTSAIQQNLVHKQLLPVIPEAGEDVAKFDFIYEPDENTIIEDLGQRYLGVDLWIICLESNAAEQGARMTAMDNATTNAEDLISDLSLLYNRERQSQITTQIIEVASGAEATSS